MKGDSKGVYSIGAVARMLGVPAQTLRAWEDRYGQIVPARSAGGQRLYSRDQVDQLRFVREQLDSGLQPADAHRLLAERRQKPMSPGTERVVTPADSSTQNDDSARLVILLAERDTYAADFADYFLRTEGYAVHIVLDASEAGRILERRPPDLVVVDLMISGGAGLKLCSGTRDRSAIPILAVSAIDSGDVALEAGADAFLQKPLDPLQFVSTVRDLLGTSAYLRRGSHVR
ncbi:MerR family transcriptional regulator [Jiangella asiatica]|uniref:MerR family transcriptional regulator n=1 Tax=Jiangella asiatica TaxID=2530372 RepID=A0A4V2Z2N1_9ACTN|nr:MerR family transcriptional regulator [Jiangella asiatica]TDE09488.1 MerR family transcriptional regulator [Jiangella asiatica]